MRIGVLTSLYPGPTRPFEGIFAERRWLGMAGRGHAVSVCQPMPLTPGPFRAAWREIAGMPRDEQRGPIRVVRPRYLHLPGRARRNARVFARKGAAVLLAGERPDCVVADYAWPAAAVAPHLVAAGVPLVVSGRGSDVLQVAGEAGLEEELARYLSAAGSWCAVSRDLVLAMDRLAGRPGHGHLVPNGVDLETFRPREPADCRRRLGLPETGRLVLSCGHLIPRKDPLLALEVFARARRSDDRLVYLGRGPLASELRARIDALGLGGCATLAGEVRPEELADWYGACDVLLLTSRREGRPNVVLEALASGRAVCATAAGGTGELLEGAEGTRVAPMLSPTRDPENLAGILRALLDSPPDPAELRGMVEHLSWSASFEALERCLAAAVGGG